VAVSTAVIRTESIRGIESPAIDCTVDVT